MGNACDRRARPRQAVAVREAVSSVPTGAATVQILVDSPDSALANLSQETVPLTTRASVFAQVMTSAAVLENIAGFGGRARGEITAQGPYSGPGEALDVVTPSEARGNQIAGRDRQVQVDVRRADQRAGRDRLGAGPHRAAAARVAASIYPGVQAYVSTLQQQSATPRQHRVTIRQLGPPQAGPVNSSSRSTLIGRRAYWRAGARSAGYCSASRGCAAAPTRRWLTSQSSFPTSTGCPRSWIPPGIRHRLAGSGGRRLRAG